MLTLLLCAILGLAQAAEIPDSRIIGGETAYPGQYASMTTVHRLDEGVWAHVCGGSLIDTRWVVTAAHCVHDRMKEDFKVYAGAFDITDLVAAQERMVLRYIVHPDYSHMQNYPSDIALLEFAVPFTLTSVVDIIAMPEQDGPLFTDALCHIPGWGKLNDADPEGASILHTAEVMVMDNMDCDHRWTLVSIWDMHICVWDPAAQSKGACQYDSGGPLVCEVGPVQVMAGVASFVRNGCNTAWPSVYTRITTFRDWINYETGI